MCGPRGDRGVGGRLAGGVRRRHELDEGLALRVDDTEDGAGRVGAGREVVASVASIEPDFIAARDAQDVLVDATRRGIHDHRDRHGGVLIARSPRLTGRVEGLTAPEEQILPWTEGEPGRLAVVDQEHLLHGALTAGVDSHDCPDRAAAPRPAQFRYGQIELPGARIPYGLFCAIGRVDAVCLVQRDGLARSEPSGASIDRDQRGERRVVGVVYHEENSIPRVIGELIGAQHSAGGDVAAGDHLVAPEIDADHPAVGVRDEEPVSGDHDAVRPGSVVVCNFTARRVAGVVLERDPGEIPLDRLHECVRSRVDDVDAGVRAIAEVVELAVRIEPADIKRDEGFQVRRDRDGRQKPHGPPRSPRPLGQGRIGAEQQKGNDDGEKQQRRREQTLSHHDGASCREPRSATAHRLRVWRAADGDGVRSFARVGCAPTRVPRTTQRLLRVSRTAGAGRRYESEGGARVEGDASGRAERGLGSLGMIRPRQRVTGPTGSTTADSQTVTALVTASTISS